MSQIGVSIMKLYKDKVIILDLLYLSQILGSEVVGTVEELGIDINYIQVGSRVAVPLFAIQPTGGYAEYVKIPANFLVPIPDSIVMNKL